MKGGHVVRRQNNNYLNLFFFFFKRPLSTSMLKNFQNHNVDYSCWDFLSVISKYIVQNVWLAIWYQCPGMSYHDLWMILWCRADSSELKHSLQKVERKSPNSRSKQTLEVNKPHFSGKTDPLSDRRVTGLLHRATDAANRCWGIDSPVEPQRALSNLMRCLQVVQKAPAFVSWQQFWYCSCFWVNNSSHILL